MSSLTLKQNINAFKGMTVRNIKVYFKDKGTVFFSILAPLIVFMLYILFLKDTYIDGIMQNLNGAENLINKSDIDSIANTWLLAGILASSTITVSFNSLSVMVGDKERKVDYDFNSSPCYGMPVILSYFVGAFINTFIISTGILAVGLIVISIIGNAYLTFVGILELLLITIIASASSTMIMMVIASLFKKMSSLGAFGGLISAAIGFIIGAYIPLGSFDQTTQSIMAILPGSQIAALYRNVLMSGCVENAGNMLGNGAAEFTTYIKDLFSLSLNMFGYKTTKLFSYLYATGSIFVALGVSVLLYRKTSQRA